MGKKKRMTGDVALLKGKRLQLRLRQAAAVGPCSGPPDAAVGALRWSPGRCWLAVCVYPYSTSTLVDVKLMVRYRKP